VPILKPGLVLDAELKKLTWLIAELLIRQDGKSIAIKVRPWLIIETGA